ncbi:MAG: sulfatase [Blastopirellula sp.]|nr:sulfatase [Blastopirellula sp.]
MTFAPSRRELLRSAGAGMGLLGLSGLLESSTVASAQAARGPHFVPRAKRVISLFMGGGPSQVDTFDPKPKLAEHSGDLPEDIAESFRAERLVAQGGLMPSPFKFRQYGESGIPVSELLPRTAAFVDDMAVVRSLHTDFPNHAPALCMMNLGVLTPTRPSLGSWTTYGLGTENENLPGFVVLCPGKPVLGPKLWSNAFLPGRFQGTHLNHSKPQPEQLIPHLKNAALDRNAMSEQLDLIRQLNARHRDQRTDADDLDTRIRSMELAFRMQSDALDAFDISREPESVQTEYGSSRFSRACLMARRLSERGVRFVQLYYGSGQPWDTHGENDKRHRQLCGDIDRPVAALLGDLKRRGLLEETLVTWGGEFGRTPTTQGKNGRDHNQFGFSWWLAGGGIRGGTVHGATDEFGFRAIRDKVHVHDLHATILHLLGIDHERLVYRYSGRDFRLTDVRGRVINEIVA